MIKEVKMFTIICDNCKIDANEDSEFSCYNERQYMEDVAKESNWIENEGNHYCPDCYSFDDNDELVINLSRKK